MNGTTHSNTTAWLLSFAVFFGLGSIVLGTVWPGNVPAQPIRFNHAVHVSNGLTCEDCHVGAMTREKATLPQLDTCLTCHSEAVTTKPEIAKKTSTPRNPLGRNFSGRWLAITARTATALSPSTSAR